MLKILFECFVKTLESVGFVIRRLFIKLIKNFEIFVILIQPLITMFMIYYLLFNYTSKEGILFVVVVMTLITLIICNIISEFRKLYIRNQEEKMPIPSRRFTTQYSDRVEVEKQRFNEMILYMNDLENYLERNGLLHESKNEEKSY